MAKAKKCANPLFEQWLKEWQDEAKARDLQMQFCFGKALDSLRRYPLVLETGRDCIILKHFGHKLCDMLDKKLSQHKLLNNLPSSSNDGSKKPRKRERKKTESGDAPKNDSSLPEGTCSSPNKISSNSSKEVINDDSLPAKKRKSVNKPYVPKIGSAAFAILITMYKNSQQPNYPGHMFKKDIIFQAQAESDCQMKGTALEHYSGWSSMTTLISKNLVSKKSSPAKYSLTDSGLALAISLYEGHLNVNSDEDNGLDAFEKVLNIDKVTKSLEAVVLLKDKNKTKNLPEKPQETNASSTSKASDNFDYQVQVSNSPLHFESADRDFSFPDTSVFNHENQYNLVNSDDDDNVFEVESKYGLKNDNVRGNKLIKNDSNEFNSLKNLSMNSPIKSSVRKEVPMENVSTVNNDIIVINDDEDDCDSNYYAKDQIDNKLKYDTEKSQVENFRSTQKASTSSEEDFKDFCRENVEPMITVKNKHEHSIYSKIIDESLSTELHDNEQNNDPIEFVEIDENIEKISGVRSSNVPESNNKAKPKADEPIQMHNKETAISDDKNKKTTKKTEIPAEINTELFYLLPNNFDIILLVDTQETSGLKAKAKNDATVSELSKQGVVFEIRSLNVGDFTWIARCRFTKKELVLPYIVERKRIDDLCASIKDSRYHEQKFRLKQSGIKNVIYLIENYGKSYHGCIPMTSLLQAGVNALIQDDFTVKYTRDHKDSMRYLSTMTTILTNIFEGKELISCSKDAINNIEAETSEGTEHLIEFSEFNKSSVKTKKFKIREMFIKQLLQLKGLSVDKAVAIAELYPTPKILSNALKQSDDKLLADVVTGPNKRKIGPAISKTVYQLYTKYDLS